MIFNSPTPNMRTTNGDDTTTDELIKNQRTTPQSITGDAGDGSSIEISKRPRGRPPGSKNKPKPPIIITREAEPSSFMRPHILEIPANTDIIDSLIKFSRRKSLGICVLAGTGTVTNLTLRQPPHPMAALEKEPPTTVGFRGRYEILSLSMTVMPEAAAGVFLPAALVTVAGPQGQVIGGTVVGPLMAAGTVTVVAGTFNNPTFHRLPTVEDDVAVARSGSMSGGGEHSGGAQQQETTEEEHQQHYSHREYQESCGMAIYSPHFPSEVVWEPNSRPQPRY